MSLSVAEDSEQRVKKTSTDEQDTKQGDEQSEGLSLAVTVEDSASMELTDPAILEVRNVLEHRHRYSREELLKLRDVPLSRKKPEILNAAHNISLEFREAGGGWAYDKKRAETPAENGNRSADAQDQKRRPGDPRERLRKEQDRIVLSPQRESFNHGCCVPGREVTRSNRSHSPIGGKTEQAQHIGNPPPTRRIGSGRIIREPWDYPEKAEVDFGFRRERREGETEGRYERRSFGRDFEANRDKEKEGRDRHIGRSNGRFNDRRRVSGDNREEEPEWFSGGPVSQTDTIELRGFEDSDKATKKKQTPPQKKRNSTVFKGRILRAEVQGANEMEEGAEDKKETNVPGGKESPAVAKAASRKTPTSPGIDKGAGGDNNDSKMVTGKSEDENVEHTSDNLDYFLSGSIPKLLTNGVGGDGDAATAESRFTQFFNRAGDASQKPESRRSSLQDDHIIRNLLRDISEPSVSIPGDSNLYFAPISPAANTGGNGGPQHGSKPMNDIMEMLRRGKQQQAVPGDLPPQLKSMEPGKIMHLDEIEAFIRQGTNTAPNPSMTMPPSNHNKSDEEEAAFRKIMAQMSVRASMNSNNGSIPQKTPMSIMEMLSHSQQQDEAARMAHLHGPPQHSELAARLQQLQTQQQRQLEAMAKLMGQGAARHQQVRNSPLPPAADVGMAQTRELLNRPEAQAILQGLQRGDITPQHLYQQLAANPAMQPRHRELLLTILKLQGGGGGVGPSPRVLSPVPPPLFTQQQQQQLRVSPLPPNAMHQRIPSPRELQVHTQNILQRALIKKKLEEQQENYRKKQEMQQRGQSPSGGVSTTKSVASPTPLAFTPTSVLRKMTAEKEEGGKEGSKTVDMHGKTPQGRPVTGVRPQVQQQQPQMQPPHWNAQYNVKQAGRPILKSNASYQQQQQPPMQNAADQQHYYQQQQQQRMFNQQQQRKNMPYNNPGVNSAPQYAHTQFNPNHQIPQLTQQQLRAQHQQHVRSAQQNQQAPYGQQPWQPMHGSQQQNYDERSSHVGRGVMGTDGGDLSPTSDQIARWFSPKLWEKAKAGQLPPTAGLLQNALSLEEIERQTAAPVHN